MSVSKSESYSLSAASKPHQVYHVSLTKTVYDENPLSLEVIFSSIKQSS